jgi:hypothetical protein
MFGFVLLTSVALHPSTEVVVLARRTDPSSIRETEILFLLGLVDLCHFFSGVCFWDVDLFGVVSCIKILG